MIKLFLQVCIISSTLDSSYCSDMFRHLEGLARFHVNTPKLCDTTAGQAMALLGNNRTSSLLKIKFRRKNHRTVASHWKTYKKRKNRHTKEKHIATSLGNNTTRYQSLTKYIGCEAIWANLDDVAKWNRIQNAILLCQNSRAFNCLIWLSYCFRNMKVMKLFCLPWACTATENWACRFVRGNSVSNDE